MGLESGKSVGKAAFNSAILHMGGRLERPDILILVIVAIIHV